MEEAVAYHGEELQEPIIELVMVMADPLLQISLLPIVPIYNLIFTVPLPIKGII
jgi:hypothetical protein